MLVLLLGCTQPHNETGDTAEIFDEYEALEVCPDPGGVAYLPPVPPNVMLMVDRSGSMDTQVDCDATSCPTRWETLMGLAPIVEALGASTRAGLTAFPDRNGQCEVEDIEVPVGEGTSSAILQELSTSAPSGFTPVAETLTLLRREGRLQDPYRDNVLVLLSDGLPTCAGVTASIEAVDRLTHLDEPVAFHVISFAAEDEAKNTLEQMAEVGGEATGGNNYYEADTLEELMERLGRVAASLDTCAFALREEVAAEELTVTVLGVEVEACTDSDCVQGYVYDEDARVVRLAAGSCREIAGEVCPDVRFDEGE